MSADRPAPRGTVLVVDDDPAVSEVLCALLRQDDLEAVAAGSGEEALRRLEARPFDAAITDLKMPGMDGLTLLHRCLERWPDLPVLMLTAHGSIPLAVEAMRLGAADFVAKPFDRDELLWSVGKALQKARPEGAPSRSMDGEGLSGASTKLREAEALLHRVARSEATVLIRGETGTGKEVAARALHARSPRAGGPFVKVHCAGLPDALLQSELFGYEKGAFTGAVRRKPGRVDLAQGGTLFLDEIGDASAAIQLELLRLLQDREYERLGGTETLQADVRFVAATHRDLERAVEEGVFREDLYYRLNVVPVDLPPLRERPGDVQRLAEAFCARFSDALGREGCRLSEEALERLAAAPWPGNVRQLENLVERLVVLADGFRIEASEVERELAKPSPGSPARGVVPDGGVVLEARVRAVEREALSEALERAGGNRTLAARLLGVSRRTLYNKLGEYGLA